MQRVHPPILAPGSRIAVSCPASPIIDEEPLTIGLARLRAAGLDVVVGASCSVREGLWAGSDDARARELLGFLSDPKIEAIIAGRGGVGSMRLLPRLDELLLEIAPKWIIGRSDLTALHLAFWKRFGLIGLSGPMVATDLGGDARESVVADTLRILTDPSPIGLLAGDSVEVWKKGTAEGHLIPANLSLLNSLVGTPYLPSLTGAILVLEEIGEPPHRCDRMLTQLELSRSLDGLAGLVFGQFTDCAPGDADPAPRALPDLLRSHAETIGAPTLAGFPYGHEALFRPLPLGVRARISNAPPGLVLLEGVGAPRRSSA